MMLVNHGRFQPRSRVYIKIKIYVLVSAKKYLKQFSATMMHLNKSHVCHKLSLHFTLHFYTSRMTPKLTLAITVVNKMWIQLFFGNLMETLGPNLARMLQK